MEVLDHAVNLHVDATYKVSISFVLKVNHIGIGIFSSYLGLITHFRLVIMAWVSCSCVSALTPTKIARRIHTTGLEAMFMCYIAGIRITYNLAVISPKSSIRTWPSMTSKARLCPERHSTPM